VSARNTADLRAQLELVSRQLDEVSAAGWEVNLIEQAYALGSGTRSDGTLARPQPSRPCLR
jgi:hypothetical protein